MSELVISLPTDAGLREAVGEIPGTRVVIWDLDGAPPESRIDMIVPPYLGSKRSLTRVGEVETRLVQSQSIGYEGTERYLPAGVPFANAATVHETSTAELALTLALAMQRAIPRFVRDAQAHRWDSVTTPSLADCRVLIVGYGGVGKATDARLAGFEVSITRVAQRARQDHDLLGQPVRVHGIDELPQLLASADIVILAVPLNDSTRGLMNARTLARMPDSALLINVARGGVVETDALVAELRSGRLRAALDVTDPEPLPADHPLWECPGTLITPHVGGDSAAMLPRVSALIRRQVARMHRGEQPENLLL